MKLKDFIKLLKDIADKNGDSMNVIMADDIPVVEPKFIASDRYNKPAVVITDRR